MISCEFCKMFKNTFFNRTPVMNASSLFQMKQGKSTLYYTLPEKCMVAFPLLLAINSKKSPPAINIAVYLHLHDHSYWTHHPLNLTTSFYVEAS